eukprot:Awhi_evm2s536
MRDCVADKDENYVDNNPQHFICPRNKSLNKHYENYIYYLPHIVFDRDCCLTNENHDDTTPKMYIKIGNSKLVTALDTCSLPNVLDLKTLEDINSVLPSKNKIRWHKRIINLSAIDSNAVAHAKGRIQPITVSNGIHSTTASFLVMDLKGRPYNALSGISTMTELGLAIYGIPSPTLLDGIESNKVDLESFEEDENSELNLNDQYGIEINNESTPVNLPLLVVPQYNSDGSLNKVRICLEMRKINSLVKSDRIEFSSCSDLANEIAVIIRLEYQNDQENVFALLGEELNLHMFKLQYILVDLIICAKV